MGKGSTYILLDKAAGEDHVPHMLGRVVVNQEDPVGAFVPHTIDVDTDPADRKTLPEPFHPDTIVPDIMDEPIVYDNFEEVKTAAKAAGADLRVTKIINGNIGQKSTKSTERSARRAIRYQMSNHQRQFDRLMRNPRYKQQVTELYHKNEDKKLSFVTSVLTAQDLLWNENKDKQSGFGFGARFSLQYLTGGADAGVGDIEAKIDYVTSENKKVKASVKGEIIIALAYEDTFVDEYFAKERKRWHRSKKENLTKLELPFSGGESDGHCAKSEPTSAVPSEKYQPSECDDEFVVKELEEDGGDMPGTEHTDFAFQSLQSTT